MANFCNNHLMMIAPTDDMRGILLEMAKNLKPLDQEGALSRFDESSDMAELSYTLAEFLRRPLYLYALTNAPEHRHMSDTGWLSCEPYTTDWWWLTYDFWTDWGPADTELSTFYAQIESYEFGWLVSWRAEGERRAVTPYKDVELDPRFDDYYTLDDCFYASYYHRMTGAVPPPNQYLVRALIGREDIEALNEIASNHDISKYIEELNPRDLFKKGLYRSFSYVLERRKYPYRATRPTELIANAAMRGDDEMIDALIEGLDWSRAKLDRAERELPQCLEGDCESRALAAVASARALLDDREAKRRADALAEKKKKEENVLNPTKLYDPSIDYSQPLERTYWDHVEPLVSVVIKEEVWKGAFKGCGSLETVILSGKEYPIGIGAFSGCGSLSEIKDTEKHRWSDQKIVLKSRAFEGCKKLRSATIKGCVIQGTKVFDGCSSLKSLSLLGWKKLKANAFGSLPNLETMRFLAHGEFHISKDAFKGCTGLKRLVVSRRTTYDDGALAELPKDCNIKCTEETELLKYARSLGFSVVVGR